MMICPETFYEEKLKGKTPEQIMTAIRSLKREISRLKNIAEHPEYQCMMHPSESVRIMCLHEYLERAKMALVEAGGEYTPTAAERRVMDFDANIENIEKITFNYGDCFANRRTYTVRIEEPIKYEMEIRFAYEQPVDDAEYDPVTKAEFFEMFSDLHIGEWKKYYDTERFGYFVLDGIQWDLTIEYNNGRKEFKCSGSNAYPYNFDQLVDIMGATDFMLELNDNSPQE